AAATFALLVWALWRGPATPLTVDDADHSPCSVTAVIVAERAQPHDLRATLVALGLDADAIPAVVVDLAADQANADVVAELAARYCTAHPHLDPAGLATAAAACETEWMLFFAAGDIPATGAAA